MAIDPDASAPTREQKIEFVRRWLPALQKDREANCAHFLAALSSLRQLKIPIPADLLAAESDCDGGPRRAAAGSGRRAEKRPARAARGVTPQSRATKARHQQRELEAFASTTFSHGEAELESVLRSVDRFVGGRGTADPSWSDLQPLFDAAEILYPRRTRRRFTKQWEDARHAFLAKYKEYSQLLPKTPPPSKFAEASVRYRADASGNASDKGNRPFWKSLFKPKGMREAEAELESVLRQVDRFV